MMTPLKIEILLWYYHSSIDFPGIDSPAAQDAVREFCKLGILKRVKNSKSLKGNHNALDIYIKGIQKVPLPTTWMYKDSDVSKITGKLKYLTDDASAIEISSKLGILKRVKNSKSLKGNHMYKDSDVSKITGKLKYLSMFDPIELTDDASAIEIKKIIFDTFTILNRSLCSIEYDADSIKIVKDNKSDSILKFAPKQGSLSITLEKNDNTRLINVASYISMMFERLNGRTITLLISDSMIEVSADQDEEVHGVYYTDGDGNLCKLTDDEIKELCKVSTDDCCIFLTLGSDGFQCAKFSSLSRVLLDKYSRGEIKANRIGNCKNLGRKDDV